MRQLLVIALVTLIAGSAFAGTVVATDPPDIRLGVGEALPGAFDLSDYVVGGEGDVVDIAGSSAVGVSEQTYTVAGETVSNVVKVSSFLVQNGPMMDGDDGNPFVNVLDPGQAVSSVEALVGGGGSSPGGVSAAWSVTFANVSVSYNEGLRVRNTAMVTPQGLTANIDAGGNYTLSCDASFAGPVIVSFVAGGGDDVDGTSLLASKNLAAAGQSITADGTAAPSQQIFATVQTGVTEVTVSCDYVAQTKCSVALAAMDSSFSGAMAYVNPTGSVVAGQAGTLTVVYTPASGAVIPLVQAAGGVVTFSNVKVYAAPSLVDLAYGANELPLTTGLFSTTGPAIDGNLDSVTDVSVLSPGAPNSASTDVSISTDNNFGEAGQSIALGEAGAGFDNISVVAAPSAGCVAARAWIKGEATQVNFVLTALDAGFGASTAIGNQVNGGAASWTPMLISGGVTADVAMLDRKSVV